MFSPPSRNLYTILHHLIEDIINYQDMYYGVQILAGGENIQLSISQIA